jgi:polysaccharide pyruvyl transferase WcaK-like protein
VGLALRGRQSDYGEEVCTWREVEDLALKLASDIVVPASGRMLEIENHLVRSNKTPIEIENLYVACDLVITSRFHGAVTAMKHGIPFIAIDQIQGGAKVYNLLAHLGWPHVYKIDEVDNVDLAGIARALLSGSSSPVLRAARGEAIRAANKTLEHLDRWIASLP